MVICSKRRRLWNSLALANLPLGSVVTPRQGIPLRGSGNVLVRWHVVVVLLVALAMAGSAPAQPPARSALRRPNVVFLLADDLGWTGLRCFGSDFYETPRLDQLAEQGLRFTQAYAACTGVFTDARVDHDGHVSGPASFD